MSKPERPKLYDLDANGLHFQVPSEAVDGITWAHLGIWNEVRHMSFPEWLGSDADFFDEFTEIEA